MPDCCLPVETGQNEATWGEGCCTPVTAGNQAKSANEQANRCPACGQKGKKVERITLKSMLVVSLRAVRDGPYLFCRAAACPVVYFAGEGSQFFTKDQLRIPVHQKEPDDETAPVCYCFRHSPASIQAELLATGQSTVIEEINAGVKAGQCACEIRNPQGSCCLGNVSVVVKQIAQAVPGK